MFCWLITLDQNGQEALLLAPIKEVDPLDIPIGHFVPLADLGVCVGDGSDGVPSIDRKGGFSIVHDGGVVVGSVQVVGVLLLEVVGILRVDVLPVDPNVAITVAPGLLVIEAQSVVDLVLDDAVVDAALSVERDYLSATCSAHRREASASALDAYVVVLVATGDKADAGACVEGLQASVDDLRLCAGELIADDEGNRHQAVGGFLPEALLVKALHCISGSGNQHVSFQQHLIGAVVGVQNPGGDIDAVIFVHLVICFASFINERICF